MGNNPQVTTNDNVQAGSAQNSSKSATEGRSPTKSKSAIVGPVKKLLVKRKFRTSMPITMPMNDVTSSDSPGTGEPFGKYAKRESGRARTTPEGTILLQTKCMLFWALNLRIIEDTYGLIPGMLLRGGFFLFGGRLTALKIVLFNHDADAAIFILEVLQRHGLASPTASLTKHTENHGSRPGRVTCMIQTDFCRFGDLSVYRRCVTSIVTSSGKGAVPRLSLNYQLVAVSTMSPFGLLVLLVVRGQSHKKTTALYFNRPLLDVLLKDMKHPAGFMLPLLDRLCGFESSCWKMITTKSKKARRFTFVLDHVHFGALYQWAIRLDAPDSFFVGLLRCPAPSAADRAIAMRHMMETERAHKALMEESMAKQAVDLRDKYMRFYNEAVGLAEIPLAGSSKTELRNASLEEVREATSNSTNFDKPESRY